MYIMSEDQKQIINADYPERYCLVEKPDAVLVIASYRDDRPPVTLGRYKDMKDARDVIGQLLTALTGGQAYFHMPESRVYDEARTVRDARTKRKGGS